MIDRLRTRLQTRLDAGRRDDGFTLIELLIVIVILGILAGIVVFAVGGISDRGQAAACSADRKTIKVAQEAHFSQKGSYAANGLALKNAGFIADESKLYTTATTAASAGPPVVLASYSLTLTAAGTAAACTV